MKGHTNRRTPIFTIFLTIFIDLLGVGIIIPILAPLLLDKGGMLPPEVSFAQRTQILGFLIATFSLFQFLFAPLLGSMSDKYGRKKVLFSTLFVTFFSYLLFAYGIYVHNIVILFISRAFQGIAASNISIIYSALADISTPQSKAKNFGLVGMAFGLGFIIGPVLGGVLSDDSLVSWFSFSTPFLLAAGLALVNIFLVKYEFQETLTELNVNAKITPFAGLKNLKKAFSNEVLRVVFLVVFFFTFGFTFFTQFFQVYLIEKFYFDQSDIGFLFGYIGILLVFTQGVLVRAASRRLDPQAVLVFSLLLLMVGYLVLLIPDTTGGLYAVLPLIPIAQGLTSPNLSAMISNSAPRHLQGETLGMQQSVQSLAQLLPPIIGGFVVALTIDIPMWLAAGCALLSWLVFIFGYWKKSKKKKAAQPQGAPQHG